MGVDPASGFQPRTATRVLRALNAANLVEIWNSSLNSERDGAGLFAKFSAPTVVNGKVYLGTFSNQLVVH